MIDFRMPALGADMDAGTLAEWLKRPGDDLKRGDIIAVVETQKGAIEIEVFNDGKLEEIRVSEGEKVPVGTVLATIRESAGPARPKEPRAMPTRTPAPPAALAPKPAKPPPAAPAKAPPGRRKVTPKARKRAAELSIDIKGLAPGPDGVIGLAEVEAATAVRQPRRPALDRSEMRKAIAAAMARANREIPHYYVSHTIDMTHLLDWLQQANATRPMAERLLYAAPLLKALALALKEAPTLNGHYVDDVFRPAGQVNIGLMTALRGGGLIAPSVLGVEALSVDALMTALRDLVTRARTGRIRSSELTETTITFSNLGEDMAEAMLPIIYPPQVAIIGSGSILQRAWVVGGGVASRQVLTVTVAGDHRVSDGRQAALFLKRLEALAQMPEAL